MLPEIITSNTPELRTAPFMLATKKPVSIQAVKLAHTTTVETAFGPVVAEKGDWLIRANDGEVYPVPADVFMNTYDFVDEENTNRRGAVVVDNPYCNDPAYIQMFGELTVEDSFYDDQSGTATYFARSAKFDEFSGDEDEWPVYLAELSTDGTVRFVRSEQTARVPSLSDRGDLELSV